MAQYSKSRKDYYTSGNNDLYEVVMLSDRFGNVDTPVEVQLGLSDAFGRARVSQPYTLGDYKHLYGIDTDFIEYAEGDAEINFQPNKACARLSTTSNILDRMVHQSKFYHHYMPGKSQLILSSFNFYAAIPGVTKRTGYFDDSNGIYFEQNGDGILSIVIRSSTSGAPVENRIVQTEWNVDKCDGTGNSKWNINITKTQLLWCDFQWLGVGRVRVGFVHDNEYILCHTFYHSDTFETVYISNPNLPVRCEIFNTGETSGGYFDQICTTVISEGGYTEIGQDWSTLNTTLRTIAGNTTLPVIAIRLKNLFKGYDNRILTRLQNLTVMSETENVSYKVIKLTDISQLTTATSWVSLSDNSAIEVNYGATTYTDGDILVSGFCTAGNSNGSSSISTITPSTAKKNYIVQNYDSTDSEIYIVTITNLAASQSTNVAASLQWREIY